MTDAAHHITDDQLHAYVDGFLDGTARQAVEQYLAANPEAAARVKSWQAINAGLQRLGGTLVPDPARTLDWKRGGGDELAGRRNRRKSIASIMQVAAVAASLAVGVFGGWYAHDRMTRVPDQQFAQEAAVAYKVFASPVQARPVEISADERDRLQRWLSHKMSLDFPMKVPQLDGEGWSLVGGRLLSNTEGPAALYVYKDAAERRIALYVVAKPQAVNKPLTWPKGFPVEICDWGNDRLHMALAGPVDRVQMKKLLGPINTQIIAGRTGDGGAVGAVPELPAPQVLVSLNPHR